ncbi:MAG: HAMP domain-containing sensor histidine kinase [Ignavibacteriales bacterium]|nr:HAMP domain-containing sensor histidine kinase [Ignavibacteriales bacterium]
MRWFDTLKGRLLLGSFLLLILFGIYSYFSVRFYTDQMMSQVLTSANRISDAIKSSTHFSMLLNRKGDVYEIINALGKQPGINGIRIYNKRGAITFSTQKAEQGEVVDLKAEACYGCHDAKRPLEAVPARSRTRIYVGQDGKRVLGLINPIHNEEQCSNAGCHSHPTEQTILGVLDVRMSLGSVDEAIASSQLQIIIVAVFLLLVVGSASVYVVSTTILSPVANLVAATKEVSSGNLNYEIAIRRNDEIAELARSFNSMTRSLQRSEHENHEWSATLEQRVREKTAELQKVHQQILQIEKMTSLGKLAATVAHELNNPLEGILTYSKLIGRRLKKAGNQSPEVEQTIEDIDLIQRETERCGNIVKNLLVFSKKQVTEYALIPVGQIVEKAEQILRHHFEISKVRFVASVPPAQPSLFCNENQIQQALVALFVNAVEAMPGGGTLTVQVVQDPRSGELNILVKDSGVGISPEDLPRLFEPFFTTKKNGQGVGLGLSVVYGIVERHGGTIAVESVVGNGTTFRMKFPKTGTGGERSNFSAGPSKAGQSSEI